MYTTLYTAHSQLPEITLSLTKQTLKKLWQTVSEQTVTE